MNAKEYSTTSLCTWSKLQAVTTCKTSPLCPMRIAWYTHIYIYIYIYIVMFKSGSKKRRAQGPALGRVQAAFLDISRRHFGMCMCIFVYLCVYLCIFVYIYVYLCIYIYIYIYPQTLTRHSATVPTFMLLGIGCFFFECSSLARRTLWLSALILDSSQGQFPFFWVLEPSSTNSVAVILFVAIAVVAVAQLAATLFIVVVLIWEPYFRSGADFSVFFVLILLHVIAFFSSARA